MFLIGLNPIKRIILYLIFSFFWGFLFIALFNLLMRYGYIYGYFRDSLYTSLIMVVAISVAFEILRIIVVRKYNKVKHEIEKESAVIFDKPANLEVNGKAFEGWLFLTDKNIVFKSLKKKEPQNLTLTINLIQGIDKIKLAAFSIRVDNIQYRFIVSKRDQAINLINSNLNAPN